MTHPMLDVVCRDGMFLPIPGGVYFHPGQTRASVDLMALVKAMNAPASAAYPLAVGMVVTGTDAGWDPARLTPPTVDEIWDRFGGGPAPEDVPAALLSAPGSAALIRTSGRAGAPLTWIFVDGGMLWSAGTELTPAPARLLDAVRAPGAAVAFLPPPADPAITTGSVLDGPPQIMIFSDDPPMPDAVGPLRARMRRDAPVHPVFGPDWFGVRTQAPAPAFARPPGDVDPAGADAFFRRLDLAARTGPVSLDDLPATGAVLRNAAGQQMPLHVPMIWTGSPISPDNPVAAAFMAGAAQQARAVAGAGYFTTLWVTEPPTGAGLAWAREHGIRLISVWDVYHAANPVDDEFLIRLAEHTVDGFAAAADILRWRIIAGPGHAGRAAGRGRGRAAGRAGGVAAHARAGPGRGVPPGEPGAAARPGRGRRAGPAGRGAPGRHPARRVPDRARGGVPGRWPAPGVRPATGRHVRAGRGAAVDGGPRTGAGHGRLRLRAGRW
ncbi:hypothetical protein [Catenuloplanes indicus]|uniref:Uncharacterized protein n=1 Tax=Catenuloplanes indicus TaxID=137267 RepID=A0AAE3VX29_9ACTN|nr:hypothetical protein [Catenuloplanes indicus]MDQ0364882.1 hypothetical protein [Catenuloplanes indicus]